MANSFQRFPNVGGDNNTWGTILKNNLISLAGEQSCHLYDDGGTLKLSTGKIGMITSTDTGINTIDTVTTIDISGATNSYWGIVGMSLSAGAPVFFRVFSSSLGASNSFDNGILDSQFSVLFSPSKGGVYGGGYRYIGAFYKDSSGNLAGVITFKSNSWDYYGKVSLVDANYNSFYTIEKIGPIRKYSARWYMGGWNIHVAGGGATLNVLPLGFGGAVLKGYAPYVTTLMYPDETRYYYPAQADSFRFDYIRIVADGSGLGLTSDSIYLDAEASFDAAGFSSTAINRGFVFGVWECDVNFSV